MKVRIKTDYVIDWPGDRIPTLSGQDGIFGFIIDGLRTLKPQVTVVGGDIEIQPGARVAINMTREAAREMRKRKAKR